MSHLDAINACFEAWGAVMIWLNFRRLLRDRKVMGVDWRVTGFYSVWGAWNLVYYSGVGHWLSCLACVGITAGNASWVVLALRLRAAERLIERNRWRDRAVPSALRVCARCSRHFHATDSDTVCDGCFYGEAA